MGGVRLEMEVECRVCGTLYSGNGGPWVWLDRGRISYRARKSGFW